jgi:hypothetical protein
MRLTVLVLLALALGGAVPACAVTDCDELWVTRNYLVHRAGHCFSSALGQQLFGNAGCHTTSAVLAPIDAAAVARMRELESSFGCRVNTAAAPNAAQRAVLARLSRLIDIPEPDEFGLACWGWMGPGATLHAGTSAASPVIGRVVTGQSVLFDHWSRNGWNYVTISNGPGTPVVAEGWTNSLPVSPQLCTQMAG